MHGECRRLFTCVHACLPQLPTVHVPSPFPHHSSRCVWPASIWLHTSTFDHVDLSSSLNSACHNARTAVGEPAQGVDNVGLCSVMCYFLYLTHDALAQQLCGFISRSSQCIDPMQCECHDSWHSQKSDVFLTISRTTQCVRGSTSSCSCAGEGWPYVCVCSMR